ncbi:MAG: 50S ribosomal protein L9 [Chlamydiae bacterium]|nr:50S ribosomal protein L9 [Chlamydiota bacterium]
MGNQLLLLEDVECLGRSGDLVSVKPGYARNFLVPQKKAVVATKFTLRMQEKLQEERRKRAVVDLEESQGIVQLLGSLTFSVEVKVDPEGHLYGSVNTGDIAHLLQEKGIHVEKHRVQLTRPIKTLGTHTISLKLKEGVIASFELQVVSDQPIVLPVETQETETTSTEE